MEGQFILTLPGTYHQVVNTGTNCAEACNISTPQWVEAGILASKCFYLNEKDNNEETLTKSPIVPVPYLLWPHLRSVKAFEAYLCGNLRILVRSSGEVKLVPCPSLDSLFNSVRAWDNNRHNEWIHEGDSKFKDRSSKLAFESLKERHRIVHDLQDKLVSPCSRESLFIGQFDKCNRSSDVFHNSIA
jgi:hypothetical protein